MSLTYKILWIDDRPKQVSAAIRTIENKLMRMGVEYYVETIDKVASPKSLQKKVRTADYDLIVVDYKLGDECSTGDEIIKAIRLCIFSTDIVFYSSETPSVLRTKIHVDGVYCFNREDLPSKLSALVEARVKKLCDLNFMRGLFLSMVASFDNVFDKATCMAYEKLSDPIVKAAVIENILNVSGQFYEKKQKEVNEQPKDKEISHYLKFTSSATKMTLFKTLVEHLGSEELDIHAERIRGYIEDIIVPRNQLAHAISNEIDGKYVLSNNGSDYEYDIDKFLALRHKAMDYKEQFDAISSVIERL
ncbi:hypothetical protein [Aeromonas jandaei]|uniref:hypothetical protein n=1 Tax=Aeromonas veronii TaxID=654 RepID=UPI00242CBD1C|nr:hypothetical protein [Aeromonas jandaei]